MHDFLLDRSFLLKVNRHKVRKYYAAIMVLDFQTEKPIARLEGKVISGNLNVAANSPTRKTATFSLIFDGDTYNIVDVRNLIAVDKKISFSLGLDNPFYHTEEYQKYGEILWFKQGTFVITKANSSVSSTALTVSINLSDKMAMLDGTCGGTLPASTSFHDRIIIDKEGNTITEYPLISQIITEAVHHFGGEDFSRISIEEVPDVGRRVLQYEGSTPINFATVVDEGSPTGYRNAPGAAFVIAPPPVKDFEDVYIKGDKVGYKETPLVYPGELIMKAGSTVVQVLDEIVKALGPYEYFYDVDGVFHFRKKTNFQKTGNTPLNLSPEEDQQLQALYAPRYSPTLLLNEFWDTDLIQSITFNPNYSNIKNDFVYWGSRKTDADNEIMVRYHLAIDKRPEDIPIGTNPGDPEISLCHKDIIEVLNAEDDTLLRYQLKNDHINVGEKMGKEIAPSLNLTFPERPDAWFNWREELYRRALLAYGSSTRGSYYDEELMAEWRGIFDPTSEEFKKDWEDKYGSDNKNQPWLGYNVDALNSPEKLRYWLDIIDTSASIGKYSVNRIGRRTITTEDNKINEVFSREIKDIVFIEAPADQGEWEQAMEKVKREYIPIGQPYAFVQKDIWTYFTEKSSFGTCYEGIRDQLYNNLYYNSSISMQCIPILYLDVNQGIRINAKEYGVVGDFIVNTISLTIGQQSSMTLNCQEALTII